MPLTKIPIALILGLLVLTKAYSAPPALPNDDVLRQKVVGIWFQKVSIGIGSTTAYLQVNADGTYISVGKAGALGKIQRMYKEGTWSIENGVFRLDTLLSTDPKEQPSSAIGIAQLDDKKWVFLVATGTMKGKRIERTKVAAIPEEFLKSIAELKKDLKKPQPPAASKTDAAAADARH